MPTKEKGFAIWICGLPASGKSTVTKALIERLGEQGINVQVLESDVMRKRLAPNLGYQEADREEFYRLLLEVGELLVDNGVNVIFDATAAKRGPRRAARERLAKFIEVYICCPAEVCQERDPKDIYRKAKEGVYQAVPGVQVEFEPPRNPDVVLESDRCDLQEESAQVIDKLKEKGFLKKG